jgi:hypothetical protein
MKNYLPKVFFYLLLFLTFCEPLFGESNAIYVSHYFARQFFKYFNESKVSLNCKEVVDFVQNHENEDWALKCKFCFLRKILILFINQFNNHSVYLSFAELICVLD